MALPKGNPNPWVNFFWMMVFMPSLLLLGGVVVVTLGAVGQVALEAIFG
ncbi:MAG: hypothetical protein ACYTDT_06870 [Planctomycetota bacterium]